MEKYRILGKKGEGTFSEVLKCQNIRDGTFWAAKRMKHLYKSMDEVQRIREIQVLKQLNGHPNIIFLREIIFDKRTGVLCLIFELMTMNLYEYIRGRQRLLPNDTVCRLMYQLFKGLEYLHRHGYFHRDIKPENILIKDDCLKLADFGSCRQSSSKPPLTEYISTRWYRAPECLLTDGYYRNEIDLWSAGCVMFEVIALRPLFPGSNELDQISKIHDVLGTPSASTLEKFHHRNTAVDFNFPPRRGTGIARHLPHCSSDAIDLIDQLCAYDPDDRISAREALRHPYFDTMRLDYQEARDDTTAYSWDDDSRLIRARADRMVRSDSSSSSSSFADSNSPRSTAYNSSVVHYQVFKPDFSQVAFPQSKAFALADHRSQGQSMKKPSNSNKSPNKMKSNQNHYYQIQQDPSQTYYTNLANTGTNGLHYPSNGSNHLTKNPPLPFLPRISGASALSNYSSNSGHASSHMKKSNYSAKNSASYYPIMSYRPHKK